jgi:hypothetical protein
MKISIPIQILDEKLSMWIRIENQKKTLKINLKKLKPIFGKFRFVPNLIHWFWKKEKEKIRRFQLDLPFVLFQT